MENDHLNMLPSLLLYPKHTFIICIQLLMPQKYSKIWNNFGITYIRKICKMLYNSFDYFVQWASISGTWSRLKSISSPFGQVGFFPSLHFGAIWSSQTHLPLLWAKAALKLRKIQLDLNFLSRCNNNFKKYLVWLLGLVLSR